MVNVKRPAAGARVGEKKKKKPDRRTGPHTRTHAFKWVTAAFSQDFSGQKKIPVNFFWEPKTGRGCGVEKVWLC